MKRVGNTRKASVADGDDTTLTRFVKLETERKPRKFQPRLTGVGTPAFVQQGRTKFTSRVLHPSVMSNLLVSGHNNVKIGRDVRKGKWKGYWIFTLSLEERKTCPSTCQQWQNCYGNNMPFAKRIMHTAPEFLQRLEREIDHLCSFRFGVLIRLHALGDFYSVEYVAFWNNLLRIYKNLAIYGYTAHDRQSPIGARIHAMNLGIGARSMIRNSNGPESMMATRVIAAEHSKPADAFICPEQTGKTRCCATCALCWSTQKNVAFLEH